MEKAEYDAMVEHYYGQSDDDRVNAEIARYRAALERIAAADDAKTESEREAAIQNCPRIAREALKLY